MNMTGSDRILIHTLKEAVSKFGIDALNSSVQAAERLIQNPVIDVAVWGQFKAGKSSFLNNLIGVDVLPVGVIPVTSVITRIQAGTVDGAVVSFLDGSKAEISLAEVSGYVSESQNPHNEKKVSVVDVRLTSMKRFEGLRLLDTPGLGSVLKHNSETSVQWLPETGLSIVAVSCERPLGENEVHLIRALIPHCPDIVILLTKTDFYSEEELTKIQSFVETALQTAFEKGFDIYRYSTRRDAEKWRKSVETDLLEPLIQAFEPKYRQIVEHKIQSLSETCIAYLELAGQAADKSETERNELKEKIFEEKLKLGFLKTELQLIAARYKNTAREQISQCLVPHQKSLQIKITDDFQSIFPTWDGNLNQMARKFERWLRDTLRVELRNVLLKERAPVDAMTRQVREHFSHFMDSFWERLNHRLRSVVGMSIPPQDWPMDAKEIENPDIAVSWSFDIQLDLLWFLFPMSLFRNVFFKHFRMKIPFEVEKNIQRAVSDLTSMMHKEIDRLHAQTLAHIESELNTITMLLTDQKKESGALREAIDRISELMSKAPAYSNNRSCI